jgi:hypothetical protein
MWILAPFRWVEREVCGDVDESLARLSSVPTTMAPAGVIPLIGGVARCVNTPLALSPVWLVPPGESLVLE